MRAAEIRAAAIGNFKGPRVPGHIHFNTHHENYQTLTSETRWAIFPFDLIEMNEAQISNWIRRLHDARTNARLLVQEEPAVKASSENYGALSVGMYGVWQAIGNGE